MCFGRKEKQLYDEEPARPAPGMAPQQPTYAGDGPKSSLPSSFQQQSSYQQQAPPQSPYQQQPSYQQSYHRPAAELSAAPPAPPAPVELSSDYAPPPGPPPKMRPQQEDLSYIAPPPGPPPSRQQHDDTSYAPPPGPPPSKQQQQHDDLSYIAPPPGSPPSHGVGGTEKPPQHDWQSVVPDTSLFPPPPSFFSGWDRSPASNAPEAEAEAGETWCAQHPLTAPIALDAFVIEALRAHNPRLMAPAADFRGALRWTAPGTWALQTDDKARDSCIIGYPPLYAVTAHSPLRSPQPTVIYYEVLVLSSGTPRNEVALALGFTALPYPSFRMPGWHRGSLAVHGDDGHKFINDRWGGQSFTEPFKRGETYGIGMVFSNAGGRIETEIFFTREGREVGRWNLHEETDGEGNLPVTGLEGFHDLSCAVGTYGAVNCQVVFDPARWKFVPPGYQY